MKIKKEVVIVTRNGRIIKHKGDKIETGGIKLAKGDSIISIFMLNSVDSLFIVTDNHLMAEVSLKKIKTQKRGGSGVKLIALSMETGLINFVSPIMD